jgi:hypothetical protein
VGGVVGMEVLGIYFIGEYLNLGEVNWQENDVKTAIPPQTQFYQVQISSIHNFESVHIQKKPLPCTPRGPHLLRLEL